MICHGVVTRSRADDVGPATAVDPVVAATRRDGVCRRRADNIQGGCQGAGVEVLEARHIDGVANGLVDARRHREIDRGDAAGCRQHQRVRSAAAVDRGFGAAIGDGIVAGTGGDDVGSATAIDEVVARSAGNDVGRGRAGDIGADGQRRRVNVEEVADSGPIACGLVGIAEIDRGHGVQDEGIGPGAAVDRVFSSAVDDLVIAGAARDDVGAAAAVDGVVAGTAGQDVDTGRCR